MNITNGYEYYPTPINPGDLPRTYRFTKTTTLNTNAPWETGENKAIIVEKATPINGAWLFAYRKAEPQSNLNAEPPTYSITDSTVADSAAGETKDSWRYIYHVTLNDGHDGWVEPSSVTTNEENGPGTGDPQTDPTKPQAIVTIAIIGVCLYLLSKLTKWGR